MDYKEQATTRSQAQMMLDKLKSEEDKTKLHKLVLNDRTVVYCKRKERLEDFKSLYKKK